eukprot:COSAG02_NODE_54654_length_295_cov_0.510204_1_plen_52_part_10
MVGNDGASYEVVHRADIVCSASFDRLLYVFSGTNLHSCPPQIERTHGIYTMP